MNPKVLTICTGFSLGLHLVLFGLPLAPDAPPPKLRRRIEVGLVAVPVKPELRPDRPRPPAPATKAAAAPVPPPAKRSSPPAPVAPPPRQPAIEPLPEQRPTPRLQRTLVPAAAGPAVSRHPQASKPSQPPPQEALSPLLRSGVGPASAAAHPSYRAAAPIAASNRPPVYPRRALLHRWAGEVWLRVRVTAAGQVAGVEIEKSSGFPVLDQAATRAVRGWQFQAARRDDRPVPCEVRLPVRFRLEDG